MNFYDNELLLELLTLSCLFFTGASILCLQSGLNCIVYLKARVVPKCLLLFLFQYLMDVNASITLAAANTKEHLTEFVFISMGNLTLPLRQCLGWRQSLQQKI